MFCIAWISAFPQVPKGKIVFSAMSFSSGQPSECNLYSINSDGSNERRLTSSTRFNNCPSIFNNRIVYRQTDDSNKGYSIRITDTNGESDKLLLSNKEVCNPKWKPDGTLIAYEYYPKDTGEIWVMDPNGRNNRRLIANARHPYWSADNRKILFTRNYEVYMMDLKTGAEQQLTHLASKGIAAKWPAFSPDAQKLAFVAYYGESPRRSGIYIVDLNGKENDKIEENCSMPCWTNNPKYLVCGYVRGKEENTQIILLNVETEEKIFITGDSKRNDEPAW